MDWSHTIEKEGQVIHYKEGLVSELPGADPFIRIQQTLAHEGKEPARISANVQRSLAYGEIKVGFTITVNVPQDRRWMDYAAEHLFLLATKYVNDGMSTIAPDVQPLHNPPPRTP